MKIVKKILLKFKYPYLRSINMDSNIGIYNRDGIDIFLVNFLFNIFKNNYKNLTVEVFKNNDHTLLISNVFLEFFKGTEVLFFDLENKTVCSNANFISISKINDNNYFCDMILKEYQNYFKSYEFQDFTNNIKLHLNYKDINFLGIDFDDNIYPNLNLFLSNSLVISIMIYNSGTYDKKTNKLRFHLLSLGYVYYSRVNNKHDFFILSDCINGFPNSSFETVGTSKLAKWISTPPSSNYSFPE